MQGRPSNGQGVWETILHYCAKCSKDQSNCCRDIEIFVTFKTATTKNVKSHSNFNKICLKSTELLWLVLSHLTQNGSFRRCSSSQSVALVLQKTKPNREHKTEMIYANTKIQIKPLQIKTKSKKYAQWYNNTSVHKPLMTVITAFSAQWKTRKSHTHSHASTTKAEHCNKLLPTK